MLFFFQRKQGGRRWASGKSDPLTYNSHYAQDVLKKKSTKAGN